MTASLEPLRRDVHGLVAAGLAAVDPAALVTGALDHRPFLAARRCVVLAVGKASAAMARAALARLGGRVGGGVVITPGQAAADLAPLASHPSSHPIPDERSIAAGRAALALADSTARDDLLLVLLSGGASALMAVPAPGVSLDDKQAVTRKLLAAGASIGELNCVRKHLSAIKGGQLAARAHGALATLALSDVVGDDPSVIGSGPTVPDPSTFDEAHAVIARYGGPAAFARGAVARLEAGLSGQAAETPKPGDAAFARSDYRVIGSASVAVTGVVARAAALGYRTIAWSEPVVGEARRAARRWLSDVMDRTASLPGPVCVVSAGETTVHVTGAGRGGRNQEFALALVPWLADLDRPAVVASVGTDGVDGPTDAAGALVDSSTAVRAAARGLDPVEYLEANDAWSFFESLGDLVRTGPTGTNVGDLQIALIGARGTGVRHDPHDPERGDRPRPDE